MPGGPVVAHIGPEAGRPGLATSRRKHRDWRVVGVKLVACEYVLLNRIHQRREQLACSTDPARQRRTLNRNPLAGIDLRLAIERKRIGVMWCTI